MEIKEKIKEKVSEVKEVIKTKIEEKVEKKILDEKKAAEKLLKERINKRNELIGEIRSKLLTHTRLKMGGADVRSIHAREQGYLPVLDEINKLGKLVGEPEIGLGQMRKA